jgi:hypothetical protein
VQNGKYSARADHRRHDRLLVTRFAMDDSYPGERDEARQLIASCADCAALATDLRVLASSMKHLPAPVRNRDFTISQEQADRLRGSRLTQLLRGLATPGWATLRPVAGVALSIGLVMAIVGSVLPSYAPAGGTGEGSSERLQTLESQSGGAPAPQAPAAPSRAAATAVPLPAATSLPAAAGGSAAPAEGAPDLAPTRGDRPGTQPPAQPTQDSSTDYLDTAYLEEASPEPALFATDGDDAAALAQVAPPDPTRNLLIYAGLAIAVISLGLLVLAWGARRYFADPLVR